VALDAVLRHAGSVEAVWCLGDTVGYGPEPDACVRTLRDRPHAAVAGNHDWAAVGKLGIEDFNPDAAAAARWTGAQLSADVRAYLELLPLRRVEGEFTLVHGSPRNPIWEYLFDARSAGPNFGYFQTRYCLAGHTHIPSYFVARDKKVEVVYATDGHELDLASQPRVIFNPGSVGQPRDNNPLASYALLDTELRRVVWRRVEYDIGATQRQMQAQRLPERLIERLASGW
jgi:diadenosine tetraphosphatase ApaH/serine/threonine PP2A family protein phosphatase